MGDTRPASFRAPHLYRDTRLLPSCHVVHTLPSPQSRAHVQAALDHAPAVGTGPETGPLEPGSRTGRGQGGLEQGRGHILSRTVRRSLCGPNRLQSGASKRLNVTENVGVALSYLSTALSARLFSPPSWPFFRLHPRAHSPTPSLNKCARTRAHTHAHTLTLTQVPWDWAGLRVGGVIALPGKEHAAGRAAASNNSNSSHAYSPPVEGSRTPDVVRAGGGIGGVTPRPEPTIKKVPPAPSPARATGLRPPLSSFPLPTFLKEGRLQRTRNNRQRHYTATAPVCAAGSPH